MEFDVFLSYSSKDKPAADAACHTLETAGIRCWIAPRDIIPGMDWGESIVEAITNAKAMVLIFSGSANNSPQVKREVERAVSKSIPIIPVRIENVLPTKSLEYFLGSPHWLDAFTPPLERHLQQLLKSVAAFLKIQPKPGATNVGHGTQSPSQTAQSIHIESKSAPALSTAENAIGAQAPAQSNVAPVVSRADSKNACFDSEILAALAYAMKQQRDDFILTDDNTAFSGYSSKGDCQATWCGPNYDLLITYSVSKAGDRIVAVNVLDVERAHF